MKAEEAEILLEEHLAMQQVWGLPLDYLPTLELALKSKWDESGDSLTHWELSWRPGRSIRFFNDLFGFIELPMVVIRGRKFFNKWNGMFIQHTGMLRNFEFIMALKIQGCDSACCFHCKKRMQSSLALIQSLIFIHVSYMTMCWDTVKWGAVYSHTSNSFLVINHNMPPPHYDFLIKVSGLSIVLWVLTPIAQKTAPAHRWFWYVVSHQRLRCFWAACCQVWASPAFSFVSATTHGLLPLSQRLVLTSRSAR